ncbi:carbamoyl-phosphate synthase small subunit [Symbiobacterium terraclitae]|uniref:Carbamoyl phosphate synthase small chain n=1 Tax=Symbiobacterium terraclitae TaxID=557451 RepID=A0ABS4JXB3_9FIRM|nr:carbamoyl phosphate synthase small subunit [Symbiobacterium terraclitae]MBP2020168.1 carbamoyl-phosphate synthase small subunit [Symbiobacterium terraclitae]
MKGYLVLEDGTLFAGEGFGAPAVQAGEVVFNTGMTGYQEVVTDPSYYGQIVVMTYPLIGNYGVTLADGESRQPWIGGFVVKALCDRPSHWQAVGSLSDYLAQHGVPGLSGIDTRALTRHLRSHGTMRGVIATVADDAEPDQDQVAAWVEQARAFRMKDAVRRVTTPESYRIPGPGPRVVALDFGAKENILRELIARGCDVTVLPATATAEEVLALRPDGVVLTNGPGAPTDVPEAVATVRTLLARGDLPMFGICLGHQIAALALGARTYKLPYGHRGANHPVKELATGRVHITSQNHGYAVAAESLPPEVVVTHVSIHDGTVEGIAHRRLPLFTVQYHPEACPGPRENRYLFDRFLAMMARGAVSTCSA